MNRAANALDSRQSPFVESEERPAPHVDFLAPIRSPTRAWVAEKRDYKGNGYFAQQACQLPLTVDSQSPTLRISNCNCDYISPKPFASFFTQTIPSLVAF